MNGACFFLLFSRQLDLWDNPLKLQQQQCVNIITTTSDNVHNFSQSVCYARSNTMFQQYNNILCNILKGEILVKRFLEHHWVKKQTEPFCIQPSLFKDNSWTPEPVLSINTFGHVFQLNDCSFLFLSIMFNLLVLVANICIFLLFIRSERNSSQGVYLGCRGSNISSNHTLKSITGVNWLTDYLE